MIKGKKAIMGKVYALGFFIVSMMFTYALWTPLTEWMALGKADHVGSLFWTLVYDLTPLLTVLFICIGAYVMWNR